MSKLEKLLMQVNNLRCQWLMLAGQVTSAFLGSNVAFIIRVLAEIIAPF